MSREGNKVLITAELVDAKTDSHLWTQTYDRNLSNVLALQGEVAQAIADNIRIVTTPQLQTRLFRSGSIDPEAQELYMKGMFLWEERAPRKTIISASGSFEGAVTKDPNYAEAHGALAAAYGWLGEAGWLPTPPKPQERTR